MKVKRPEIRSIHDVVVVVYLDLDKDEPVDEPVAQLDEGREAEPQEESEKS